MLCRCALLQSVRRQGDSQKHRVLVNWPVTPHELVFLGSYEEKVIELLGLRHNSTAGREVIVIIRAMRDFRF